MIKELEKLTKEEEEFMKKDGLTALLNCMTKITGETGVWQENYINLSPEICELYHEKGIIIICDGDRRKVHYGWEE